MLPQWTRRSPGGDEHVRRSYLIWQHQEPRSTLITNFSKVIFQELLLRPRSALEQGDDLMVAEVEGVTSGSKSEASEQTAAAGRLGILTGSEVCGEDRTARLAGREVADSERAGGRFGATGGGSVRCFRMLILREGMKVVPR